MKKHFSINPVEELDFKKKVFIYYSGILGACVIVQCLHMFYMVCFEIKKTQDPVGFVNGQLIPYSIYFCMISVICPILAKFVSYRFAAYTHSIFFFLVNHTLGTTQAEPIKAISGYHCNTYLLLFYQLLQPFSFFSLTSKSLYL